MSLGSIASSVNLFGSSAILLLTVRLDKSCLLVAFKSWVTAFAYDRAKHGSKENLA